MRASSSHEIAEGPRRGRQEAGFTLLEVMIALALLGLGLTVLIKSTAGTISTAQNAQMYGVVTDLARAKMHDIEEKLLKDGFTDTSQSQESEESFEDEGWPEVKYSYKVEQVELPSWDKLQDLAKGRDKGAGSGSGSGSGAGSGEVSGGFQDSALGGMLSMLDGGFGTGKGDIDSQQGASFIQSQFQMVSDVLKASIRKVTLTVKWQVMGQERDMDVVAFFTDAAAMDKVLSGLGSQDLDDAGAGGGSGSGSGSGRGSGGK
jgi:general secretion pathway protein I